MTLYARRLRHAGLGGPFHTYSNETSFVPALFRVPGNNPGLSGIKLPGRRSGYRGSLPEPEKGITNH
jgi:hypothetical protein